MHCAFPHLICCCAKQVARKTRPCSIGAPSDTSMQRCKMRNKYRVPCEADFNTISAAYRLPATLQIRTTTATIFSTANIQMHKQRMCLTTNQHRAYGFSFNLIHVKYELYGTNSLPVRLRLVLRIAMVGTCRGDDDYDDDNHCKVRVARWRESPPVAPHPAVPYTP